MVAQRLRIGNDFSPVVGIVVGLVVVVVALVVVGLAVVVVCLVVGFSVEGSFVVTFAAVVVAFFASVFVVGLWVFGCVVGFFVAASVLT